MAAAAADARDDHSINIKFLHGSTGLHTCKKASCPRYRQSNRLARVGTKGVCSVFASWATPAFRGAIVEEG